MGPRSSPASAVLGLEIRLCDILRSNIYRQSKEERLNNKPQNAEHGNAEPSSPAFEIRLFDILRFIICRLPSIKQRRKAESQTSEHRTCERRTVVLPALLVSTSC